MPVSPECYRQTRPEMYPPLSTGELYAVLQHDPYVAPILLGVYARDAIPATRRLPWLAIINLDVKSQPGSHWIAIYKDSHATEYFDSLGRRAPQYFSTYLHPKYSYVCKRLQSYHGQTCGYFCLFYTMMRARGFSMKDIIGYFDGSTPKQNDAKVVRYVQQHQYE